MKARKKQRQKNEKVIFTGIKTNFVFNTDVCIEGLTVSHLHEQFMILLIKWQRKSVDLQFYISVN